MEIIAALALGSSLTILVVAVLNYRRKSGLYIRGDFEIKSDRECHDSYVSAVLLENQKDRAVTLFGIYLQIDYVYHIEIESFKEKPLLLKPYESFRNEYGPIEHYVAGLQQVDFDDLLIGNGRKRLVLSTSEGKYLVRENVNRWNPTWDFFAKEFPPVAYARRASYKDRQLGSNVRYVVEFVAESGEEEVVPLRPGDHHLNQFNGFRLTEAAMESAAALDTHLQGLLKAGAINCVEIRVHDVDAWRKLRDQYSLVRGKVTAKPVGKVAFYVQLPLRRRFRAFKRKLGKVLGRSK